MIDQQIEIPAEDGNGATFINCPERCGTYLSLYRRSFWS
jgi:hypothetical protein